MHICKDFLCVDRSRNEALSRCFRPISSQFTNSSKSFIKGNAFLIEHSSDRGFSERILRIKSKPLRLYQFWKRSNRKPVSQKIQMILIFASDCLNRSGAYKTVRHRISVDISKQSSLSHKLEISSTWKARKQKEWDFFGIHEEKIKYYRMFWQSSACDIMGIWYDGIVSEKKCKFFCICRCWGTKTYSHKKDLFELFFYLP